MRKIITVSTNAFQLDATLGCYVATFTADTIGFDGTRNFNVCKFLKNVSGTYHNVILSYEINTSGDLMIYADEAMTGRLVLETDS